MLHDLTGDVEPETCSIGVTEVCVAASGEFLEDAVALCGWNTAAGVRDTDDELVAFACCGNTNSGVFW